MGLTIGPSSWWYSSIARACPVGTQLLDGSRIFCKAAGTAWIIAPSSTQVSSQWTDGKYNGIDAPGTEFCCISEWTTLCNRLISCGYNPCDWFVPNCSQFTSAYNCRFFWDSIVCDDYWLSTEFSSTTGCSFAFSGPTPRNITKSNSCAVRAIRCVTY